MRLHHIERLTFVVRDLESAIAEYGNCCKQPHVLRSNVPEARAIALGVPAVSGAPAALIAQPDTTGGLELIELPCGAVFFVGLKPVFKTGCALSTYPHSDDNIGEVGNFNIVFV